MPLSPADCQELSHLLQQAAGKAALCALQGHLARCLPTVLGRTSAVGSRRTGAACGSLRTLKKQPSVQVLMGQATAWGLPFHPDRPWNGLLDHQVRGLQWSSVTHYGMLSRPTTVCWRRYGTG